MSIFQGQALSFTPSFKLLECRAGGLGTVLFYLTVGYFCQLLLETFSGYYAAIWLFKKGI